MQLHEPLSEDELTILREAEVSPALIAVARFDESEVGGDRNATREAARKALNGVPLDGADFDPSDVRERLLVRSGGFVTALAEGNLADAFMRADVTNSRIMVRMFDQAYIEECNHQERAMMHTAVTEAFDRYG